ncbi:sensor histidine kinase [Leucobacter sp. wl10]|uniref:sensor histidine kinase n=1 Tax=Leucobacter sp. wl10 TaxID=2304677 RepID=UPI000E5AFA3F|nr:sensor histidine kinase [Leucobacter sp. wl10]RGE20784.1 sensor histidine kinase [Leucobacter sp. wl10]
MTATAPTSATGAATAEWVRPRPGREGMQADIGIAVLLAIASPLMGLLYLRTGLYEDVAEAWVWVVGIAFVALPLALRRRFPVPVAILVAIGFFICVQFTVPDGLIVQICLVLALYTVGAWEQNRRLALWTRFGIAAGIVLWVVLNLIVTSADENFLPGLPRTGIFSAFATFAAIQIITNLIYLGAAFVFGERSWRAAQSQAQLEAQGRELELERQTSAAQAVALDRIEIARELHDVVAHHVSVMGIQAAAARRSLDPDPDRARAALEVVEKSAHSAVEELRRLVRTLRTPETEGASTVGIAQLSALVAESQSAGVPVTLIVTGDPLPVPLLVDVALYRVVQEALTNVRKHAGRGATAEVRLRFETGAVEVEVSDDGVRQTLEHHDASGSRLGLRGMRERVGAVGGDLSAGRRERGGFMVRARVPLARYEGVAA